MEPGPRRYITKLKDGVAPSGPYSLAVISDGTVYVSGQIPVDPADGRMPEGTEEQIRQAMKNLISILSETDIGTRDLLKVTVYLTDMKDFDLMNSVYAEMFGPAYPARTCVGVSSLPKGAKIMIDAICEKR